MKAQAKEISNWLIDDGIDYVFARGVYTFRINEYIYHIEVRDMKLYPRWEVTFRSEDPLMDVIINHRIPMTADYIKKEFYLFRNKCLLTK